MSYLNVTSATKTYGHLRALDNVSLAVEKGEFVSLLGPSGCGKTTLLRMLAGLVPLESGRIVLDGEDISTTPVHRRDIGFVFQNYALFPHMTIAENIAFGLEARGRPKAEIKSAIVEALELVSLPHVADRLPRQLSGGQQQRIALARVLVTKPRLLLLDEPFSALDRQLREKMQLELRALSKRLKVTSIFVTHDQGEALVLSDRVAVMNAGRIDQLDTPAEIYERPRTHFVLEFVGLSNKLAGQVVTADAGGCVVDVRGQKFHAAQGQAQAGARISYAVRPEKISVAPAGERRETNCIEGRISEVAYFGGVTHYHVDAGFDRPVLAHVLNQNSGFAPRQGAQVVLHWQPEAAVLLPGVDA